jgi:hypothetical protein
MTWPKLPIPQALPKYTDSNQLNHHAEMRKEAITIYARKESDSTINLYLGDPDGEKSSHRSANISPNAWGWIWIPEKPSGSI